MGNDPKKYISTGGLGDSWIVYLKLRQMKEELLWHHVESNEIVPSICRKLYNSSLSKTWATFQCDPDYIENYRKGTWNDWIPISSGVDSWCPLKGETFIKLEDPFVYYFAPKYKKYDAAIQVSGGAKANRKWNFDPIKLQSMLKSMGLEVALVGTDPRYENKNDDLNFVNKTSINETLDIIEKSDIFVGLSGFLNYYACSARVKNVHLMESPEHETRYYHKLWEEYTRPVEFGSLTEIVKEVKNA